MRRVWLCQVMVRPDRPIAIGTMQRSMARVSRAQDESWPSGAFHDVFEFVLPIGFFWNASTRRSPHGCQTNGPQRSHFGREIPNVERSGSTRA